MPARNIFLNVKWHLYLQATAFWQATTRARYNASWGFPQRCCTGEPMVVNVQAEDCSPRRAHILTILVLLGATAWIALANLSTELVSYDFLTDALHGEKPPERAYGWPLAWYWRSYIRPTAGVSPALWNQPFTSFWRNRGSPWNPQEPVSRYSSLRLIGNLAIWLALLPAIWAGCMWLLRRHRLRFPGWPRSTTVLVLIVVSALFLLSNLSCDVFPEHRLGAWGQNSYGWPLVWYRHIDLPTMAGLLRFSDYSAAALTGNVVAWLATLVAAAIGWQGLLRRYRPRFRWRLRTMLAVVTIAGALCAWYVTARDRARQQDSVLAAIGGDYNVYFNRFGPKWLDFFGADPLRRCIVAAVVHSEQMNEDVFKRLAPLRGLRLLDITPYLYQQPFEFTPGMAASLGEMRQLRTLSVNTVDFGLDEPWAATRECLAALGKLTQLKRLRLRIWEVSNEELNHLAGLTNLKMLTLHFHRSPFNLARLPVLPRLEVLDLEEGLTGDEDLGRLAAFPRLKSLNLSATYVSEEDLEKLAASESLEELAIDEDIATAAGFEALAKIKRLKTVHISTREGFDESDEEKLMRRSDLFELDPTANEELTLIKLSLDDSGELAVLSSEVNGLRRAMDVLRHTHPGIVIDAAYDEFAKKIDLQPQWNDDFKIDSSMQRLLGD